MSHWVKKESQDEAEIQELAAQLREANQQQMQLRQQLSAQNSLNLVELLPPRGEKRVSSTDEKALSDDDSYRGRFGWVTIGKVDIPYIFRKSEKYCAVRILELKLLNKYLAYLHQDIYSCTCIRSYYITERESRLLNEINAKHCDYQFGRDMFTTRDLIVRLSDAHEFYNFLDVCYNKLIQGSCNPKDRCGFIRINKESVVPFTVKDNNKYVPLFYFEGETENLKLKADKLEGWDLSYLKFCCKVQGIRNELFAHDSCAVISLNSIRGYFPHNTVFEDYWPQRVAESQLLLNGRNSQTGQWIKQPTTPPVPPQQKSYKCNPNHSAPSLNSHLNSTGSAQHIQSQLPQIYETFIGLAPSNLSSTNQHQVRPTQVPSRTTFPSQVTVSVNPPSQQYYLKQPQPHQPPPPPPPLIRKPASPVRPSTTYVPSSLTGEYMLLTDPSLLSPPLNSYPSDPIALTKYQDHNVMGKFQQSSEPRPSGMPKYAPPPPPLIPVRNMNGMQQRYTASQYPNGSEVMDLRPAHQQPLSPQQQAVMPSQQHQNSGLIHSGLNIATTEVNSAPMLNGTYGLEADIVKTLIPIPELILDPRSPPPYRFQKALIEGRLLPCINMKPFVSTDLLITLPDFVLYFFPTVSVGTCSTAMNLLQIEMFRGNRLQMQLFKDTGKCKSVNDIIPLFQMRDAIKYMPQLTYMLNPVGNMLHAKRQRTS